MSLQYLVINALDVFFYMIEMLIFASILLSWIPMAQHSPIGGFLRSMTEPILGPCRRMLENSPLGQGVMLDFSPVIALILLTLVKQLLQSLVLMVL